MSGSCVSVSVSVPLRKPRFLVDWRFLVKDHVVNICIPLDIFGFFLFQWLLGLDSCFGFVGPTVRTAGDIRGRVCGCGCWWYWYLTGDRWHATCSTCKCHMSREMWQITYDTLYATSDKGTFFFLFSFCRFMFALELSLLSAHIKTIWVLWIWDFYSVNILFPFGRNVPGWNSLYP